MSPNTTKGTSCLLLKKKIRFLHYLAEDLTSFTKFVKIEGTLSEIPHLQILYFLLFFQIFCTLFCPISQNKLGRQVCCIGSHVQPNIGQAGHLAYFLSVLFA